MFKKLITNLPYSPGLLGQLSFYTGRLKQEELSRRLGLIFTAMAVALNVFAFVSPPASAGAPSNNDIVWGGFVSKDSLAAIYRGGDSAGHRDIKAIFDYHGIGEAQIKAGTDETIQSTAGNNYWSIGRTSKAIAGQFQVSIPGAQTAIYKRPLHGFDGASAYSTYRTLRIRTTTGATVWVLYGCGNIVTKGPPIPHPKPPEPPKLYISKSISRPTSGTVKPGDTIEYKLSYRNAGPVGAGFMRIKDTIPTQTTFIKKTYGGAAMSNNKGVLQFWHKTPVGSVDYEILGPSSWWHMIKYTVKVKSTVKDGTRICNRANIDAINASLVTSNDVCITVDIPEEEPPEEEEPETPIYRCESLTWTPDSGSQIKGTLTVRGFAENTKITHYVINPVDSGKPYTIKTNRTTASVNHTFPDKPGSYEVRARVFTQAGRSEVGNCVVNIQVTEEPTPIVSHGKESSNLTQEIADANGTLANAGDRIEYRLTTTNSGNVAAKDYELPAEDINDILEYADLINPGDASFDETTGLLTWDPVTVEVGETITKRFVVRIKDPIPKTPISTSEPESYDMVMGNVYGADQIRIRLHKSPAKRVETFTKQLPNTGPGMNTVISVMLISMTAYFYSRNRLMAKELKLIEQELRGA